MTANPAVSPQEVLSQARTCFGSRCEVDRLDRFVRGAHKQTFDVHIRRPVIRCLLIVWAREVSYFSERETAKFEEAHSDTVAPHAFRAHTDYLLGLDINVPRIHHFGQLDSGHHFAFIEYVEGRDYNRFRVGKSAGARAGVLREFARQVLVLHEVERGFPGGVQISGPPRCTPLDESFDASLVELRAAALTETFITENHDRIRDALGALRATVKPRETYRLLHGELDPSHVLVRESDRAVYLVDIEGLGFGDLECEHTFLKWRFPAEDYDCLARKDLDERRLAYYKLQMHISLVYAGSRLLMRHYPDRELARKILTGNTSELRRMLHSMRIT